MMKSWGGDKSEATESEYNRTTDGIVFPAKPDAEFDAVAEFTKPLKPIIFTHGIMSSGPEYLTIYRELVSHGYIVFAPTACEGSAVYTELADGTPVPCNTDPASDETKIQGSNSRVEQNQALIDEFSAPDYLQKKLGFPAGVSLDLDGIICNGHSYGGCTSIMTTVADQRIKACLCIDPWMGPINSNIFSDWNPGTRPIQVLDSEGHYNSSHPDFGHEQEFMHNMWRGFKKAGVTGDFIIGLGHEHE